MQILRVRHGFQADHSSSSYLFYAADKPVSRQGQQLAHRYSSRAEVDNRSARYQKWGDATLSEGAYKALLAEHYDVMVSESYDWWTFIITVPQTPKTKPLPSRYADARCYEDLGVDVAEFGSRWAISIYCVLDYDLLAPDRAIDDSFEYLTRLLTAIRKEIIAGDFSFLDAVVQFYTTEDEEPLSDGQDDSSAKLSPSLTKAQLQAECQRRGIEVRPSWSKDRLRAALEQGLGKRNQPQKPKVSASAKKLLNCLGHV